MNAVDKKKPQLSHVDARGRVKMVDIGEKEITARKAKAGGSVLMSETTLRAILENNIKKGDVLSVARIAGIMAAKKTADLIPLCHPLNLSHVQVELEPRPGRGRVDITAEVRLEGRTGAEMEALTAVSAAALTIYDMVKAVQKDLVITDIMLLEKSGGRSGTWKRP